MTLRRWIAAGLAGAVLVPAVVWLAAPDEPAGKSGGSTAVKLRLSVVEERGTVAAEIAESYAGRVETLSRGSIGVETTYWPTRFDRGTPAERIERAAVRAAREGEADLAIVPTHSLDDAGVTSLRALHAPFLVSSPALAAHVTTGDIAARAQAGLGAIGLTGLGLVPEGLYRPFGYLKAFVSPADFAGVTVRAPATRPMGAILRSLGARPVRMDVAGTNTAVLGGFAATPASPRLANDVFPRDAYTTADIALFPKIDAIVASRGTLERLTAGQRAVLRRAAADVRVERLALGEQRAALGFCAAGGTVVAAPPRALRELRRHTAPLIVALERDPTTKALIAAIRSTEREDASAPTCDPTSAIAVVVREDHLHPAVRRKMYVPPGSYRRVFSAAELRAAGADEIEAETNRGVITLTFYATKFDSSFVIEWPRSERRPPCRGRNVLVSRRVVFHWNPATPCSGFVAFEWRLDGTDLVIAGLDPRDDPGWMAAFVGTWKRVDCRPWTAIYVGRLAEREEERRKTIANGFCS